MPSWALRVQGRGKGKRGREGKGKGDIGPLWCGDLTMTTKSSTADDLKRKVVPSFQRPERGTEQDGGRRMEEEEEVSGGRKERREEKRRRREKEGGRRGRCEGMKGREEQKDCMHSPQLPQLPALRNEGLAKTNREAQGFVTLKPL